MFTRREKINKVYNISVIVYEDELFLSLNDMGGQLPNNKPLRVIRSDKDTYISAHDIGLFLPQRIADKQYNLEIHQWIRKHYGGANHCDLCGNNDSNLRYEWANLNKHGYERNINDYIQLCISCHRNFDNGNIDRKMLEKIRINISYAKIDIARVYKENEIRI